MTKSKYDYEVTDIDALEAFAKNAVHTEKKPVRSMITRMLDAGVEVPGIEVHGGRVK